MPYPSQEFQIKICDELGNLLIDTLKENIENEILDLSENKPLIKKERQMRMYRIYSPTCDIAIGPFSFKEDQKYDETYRRLYRCSEIATFLDNVKEKNLGFNDNNILTINKNPRCFISLEIENTTAKDVKHLLGSIMNCSLMGKVGIVVVFDEYIEYAKRLIMYLQHAENKKKMTEKLFRNVFILSKSDMNDILFD